MTNWWTELQVDHLCTRTPVHAVNHTEVKLYELPLLREEVRMRDLEAV